MQKSCYYGSWKADKLQRRKERKLAMECQKRSCFAWYWRQQNNSGKLRLSRGRRKLLFYFLFRFERFQLLTKKKAAKSTYGCVKTDGNSKVFHFDLSAVASCARSLFTAVELSKVPWVEPAYLRDVLSCQSEMFLMCLNSGTASRRTFFFGVIDILRHVTSRQFAFKSLRIM